MYFDGKNNQNEEGFSYNNNPNNKRVFAYDNDGIYFIDKLHVSFSTEDKPLLYNYDFNTYTKEQQINKSLSISLTNSIDLERTDIRDTSFNQCYQVNVSGSTFGYIHTAKTVSFTSSYLEMDNAFLYQYGYNEVRKNIYELASRLDVRISNVSRLELAYDSWRDYYDQYLYYYFQSDVCPEQVHRISGKRMLYGASMTKTFRFCVSSYEDRSHGTAYIGRPYAENSMKIYSKSALLNSESKEYIQRIHYQHFGNDKEITRTEVTLKSSFLKKNNWSLDDVLNPTRHKEIFQRAVGNRLRFKILDSAYRDRHRNIKYHYTDIIPFDDITVKLIGKEGSAFKINETEMSDAKSGIIDFLLDRVRRRINRLSSRKE